MKKTALILMMAWVLLAGTACGHGPGDAPAPSSRQEESSQPEVSLGAPQEPSQPESSSPSQEADAEASAVPRESQEYSALVVALVEQYKNGTAQTSDMFPAMPADFEFPEVIPTLLFLHNEMGYDVTSILSKDGRYELYISIDDLSYDGGKPEGNPHAHQASFAKLSS